MKQEKQDKKASRKEVKIITKATPNKAIIKKKKPRKYKRRSKFVLWFRRFQIKTKAKVVNFRFKTWASLSYPYVVLMILLIVFPLLIVLLYSIIIATNSAFIFHFTFENYGAFFSEGSFVVVLLNSITYSFFAAFIAAVLGFPVAYIMAFKVSKLVSKNVWILVTLPIWINMLLRTIGLSIIFSILGDNILIGTPVGIILAMTYMFLPFMILPIYNALEKTDRTLLEASQDLGASAIKTFWKVTFRFSLPGVFSGFTLTMLSSMTSLIVVKYIGGGKSMLISNIIESYFYRGANFSLGAAISVVLGIIVLLIILLLKSLGKWATGKKIWG